MRRERLAAKSGASRLQQITALQGGPPRSLSELEKDVPVKPAPAHSQSAPSASGTATPDPDESDISQHHYDPASQPRLPSPFAFNANQPGLLAPESQPSQPQDPMLAMLQQMMGASGSDFTGAPGAPGQAGAASDLPPGLANIFAAMQGSSSPDPPPEQSSAWIWRLVHSLFSLSLAIYIVLRSPFTGSERLRHSAHNDDWTVQPTPAQNAAHFFYLFATFEVVLQTSRYFVEKGQLQGSGILSTIAGILPPPYGGHVRTIGRYSVIWSTVVSDAMVVVFVLGAASWCKGEAVV